MGTKIINRTRDAERRKAPKEGKAGKDTLQLVTGTVDED